MFLGDIKNKVLGGKKQDLTLTDPSLGGKKQDLTLTDPSLVMAKYRWPLQDLADLNA